MTEQDSTHRSEPEGASEDTSMINPSGASPEVRAEHTVGTTPRGAAALDETGAVGVHVSMAPTTRVKLDDVNGQPMALLSDVPMPLRIGDPLGLRFRMTRQRGGRHEVLEVNGQFRVTAVGFDAGVTPRRQLLTLDSVGKPPTWVSVKKPPQRTSLAPAISPRTPVL